MTTLIVLNFFILGLLFLVLLRRKDYYVLVNHSLKAELNKLHVQIAPDNCTVFENYHAALAALERGDEIYLMAGAMDGAAGYDLVSKLFMIEAYSKSDALKKYLKNGSHILLNRTAGSILKKRREMNEEYELDRSKLKDIR
jgi:hypothetical protein